MKDKNVLRGEIYYANLKPAIGSEQGGIRPVLIIQNNIGNLRSPTIIVAAITSKRKPNFPIHVRLKDINELEKNSIVLLEQLRTLDKRRLHKYVGMVSQNIMSEIDTALKLSIGLIQ